MPKRPPNIEDLVKLHQETLERMEADYEKRTGEYVREALLRAVSDWQVKQAVSLCNRAIRSDAIDSRSCFRREFAREILETMEIPDDGKKH